jgi:hypothetical protein
MIKMKIKNLITAMTLVTLASSWAMAQTHTGNTTIQDGRLTLNTTGVGTSLVMTEIGGFAGDFRTRLAINYYNEKALVGLKHVPLIEFSADNGSIGLFGEDGSGSNNRSINSSLNLGLFVAGSGFVGIGTDTPSEALEVNGNLKLDGDLDVIGNLNLDKLAIDNATGRAFSAYYYKGLDNNPLRTRIGINYGVNLSNSITQYTLLGSKKAPLIEFDAENGSVSIFGENGSGANNRLPELSLGVFVDQNGKVGIGTDSPSKSLEILSSDAAVDPVIASQNDQSVSSYFYTGRSGNTTLEDKTVIENAAGNQLLLNPTGGNIGIGTTDPLARLSVNGDIRATKVRVMTNIAVPDYVFEPDYELPSLEEVKKYIAQHKHLSEIPSAAEIEKNGMSLGEMNLRLLKKVEELTLYQIQLMERIKRLEEKLDK